MERLARIGRPLAANKPMEGFAGIDADAVPRPTPRPSRRADFWVQLTQPEASEAGEAGSGYSVYGTDLSGRQGTHANAQYGEPRTMQVIDAVTSQLANGSEDTPFEIGNISLEGGKSFKGKYGHSGHVDGLSIDVRRARRKGAKPGPLTYRSPDYDQEIAQTQAVLKSVGGTSDLFRPPYGKKLFGLPAALKQQNLRMVMWDIEDPRTKDPAVYARRVVDAARPGSIILLHVMYAPNEPARRALPAILDGLAAKGLEVVSVSELLKDGRR